MSEEQRLREAIEAIIATAQHAVDFAGEFDSGSDAATLYAIACYARSVLGIAEENTLPPSFHIPDPDFDQYYVPDRNPETIATVRALWKQIAPLRAETHRLGNACKSAATAIAGTKDGKRLNELSREQAERHNRLNAIQPELWQLNTAMKALGVVKLNRMELEFVEQARRHLPKEVYREIKRHTVERICAQIGKTPNGQFAHSRPAAE